MFCQNIVCGCSLKISPGCFLPLTAGLLPQVPHQEHKHCSLSASSTICSLTRCCCLASRAQTTGGVGGLDGASGAPLLLPLLLLLLLRTAAHRSTRISAKISPRFVQKIWRNFCEKYSIFVVEIQDLYLCVKLVEGCALSPAYRRRPRHCKHFQTRYSLQISLSNCLL